MATEPERFVVVQTGTPTALRDTVGSDAGASGANHAKGLVPDPGATPGTTKFLREDMTYVVPPISPTPVPVTQGGTGLATLTAHAVVLGEGTSNVAFAAPSTSGQVLTSNGAGSDPTFQALPGQGYTLLTSGTVSAAATLDIVLTAYTAFRGLCFVLASFIPVTDGGGLAMRVSTNGGSSYDAGAGNYKYALTEVFAGSPGGSSVLSNPSATLIGFTNTPTAIGNDAVGGAMAVVDLLNQTSTALHPQVFFRGSYYAADDNVVGFNGAGRRLAAQDTDAVRFLFTTGNIASGTYAVYGYL